MKKDSKIFLYDNQKGKTLSIRPLFAGHYTINGLANAITTEGFSEQPGIKLPTEKNMRYGALTIQEKTAKNIFFDSNLEDFFGINRKFQFITTVKRLNSPSTYFVHCNLVDKSKTYSTGNL